MLLLCIDSSSAASVALLQIDDDPGPPSGDHEASPGKARVLAEWSTEDTRSHAEVLSPAVQDVLQRHVHGSGDGHEFALPVLAHVHEREGRLPEGPGGQ